MNRLQLVNRTKQESPHTGGDLVATASAVGVTKKMVGWVDDAWSEIQLMVGQFNWKWMRAQTLGDVTVSGGAKYTIDQLLGVSAGATRFRRWQPETEDYRVTSYLASSPESEWNLRQLDYELFAMRFMRGTHTAGAPQFWAAHPDGSIVVGPTPDQSYKLRADYWRSNQAFTSDNDVPEMPVDFHMLIVWKALIDSGAFDAAPEIVSRAASRWDDLFDKLVADQAQQLTIASRPLGG